MKHKEYLKEHFSIYLKDAICMETSPGYSVQVILGSITGIILPNSGPPFPDLQWVSCPVTASYRELTWDLQKCSWILMPHPPTDKYGIGTSCSGRCKRQENIIYTKTLS